MRRIAASQGKSSLSFFFFHDTSTSEIYTLSLHDALPISFRALRFRFPARESAFDLPRGACRNGRRIALLFPRGTLSTWRGTDPHGLRLTVASVSTW